MDRIFNVTGGDGGDAYLLWGGEKAALIDCGMAYCAPELIKNIQQKFKTINPRATLDYILISHSHYDHIGAIPYVRQVWPQCNVLGAKHAQDILKRPNALNAIRELSASAAAIYSAGELEKYEDNMMKVDEVVADGEWVDLGQERVKVIATRGHTQCSLSFLFNKTLFASESTGYMGLGEKVYASFITSSVEALISIQKCQEENAEYIISPHFGVVDQNAVQDYWDNCRFAIRDTVEFISTLSSRGYKEEEILNFYEKKFRDQQSGTQQPIDAFRLNVRNMIKTVLREML